MLLLLEIGLTIAAWRRGWKAKALLPLVIGAGSAFLIGFIMGMSGISEDGAIVAGLLFDLACIATLITMVIKPRKISLPVIREPVAVPQGEYLQ